MYMARANHWVRTALTPRMARTRRMLSSVSPIEEQVGIRDWELGVRRKKAANTGLMTLCPESLIPNP